MEINNKSVIYFVIAISAAIIGCYLYKKYNTHEGYKEAIWMDRSKLFYDYYPRSNGSIYGFPGMIGSWNMFSGYPTYPRAY